MIAWWIVPTMMSVLTLLPFVWTLRARDWFEAGILVTGTIVMAFVSLVLWITCFIVKVLA